MNKKADQFITKCAFFLEGKFNYFAFNQGFTAKLSYKSKHLRQFGSQSGNLLFVIIVELIKQALVYESLPYVTINVLSPEQAQTKLVQKLYKRSFRFLVQIMNYTGVISLILFII